MNTGATMVTDEQRLQQLGMATLSERAKAICEHQFRSHGPIVGCSCCPLAAPCRANPVPDTLDEHQSRIEAINTTAEGCQEGAS